MPAQHPARPTARRGMRSLVVTVSALLIASMTWLGASPAAAAGVLDVDIRPMDSSDSSTITSIADGQHNNRITYEVQYSCGAEACDNAEVVLSALQPDPYGVLPAGRHLLTYENWTPPVAGGTMTGTDSAGRSISLGNLAPGASGSFTVTYRIERQYPSTGNDSSNDVPNGSFYPDGFAIKMAAQMSSSTAPTVSDNASNVTWNIGAPVAPTANAGLPASIRPNENVTVPLTMNPGNMLTSTGANITGLATRNAAGSYTVTYKAPPQATIVDVRIPNATTTDPVASINHATNTITWTVGSSSNPVYAARGGWGLNQATGFNGFGNAPRNVTGNADTTAIWRSRNVILNFDGAEFASADANGCNFVETVNGELDVTVNYLDKDRTTLTFDQDKGTEVACWDAFGGMTSLKDLPQGQSTRLDGAITNMPYPISALNIPAPGAADRTGPYWRIGVSNRGNVPGVAVLEDTAISSDHIKVDRIRPTAVGMTIEWKAVDGAGNVTSGSAFRAAGADLNAVAGTWFTEVKATTNAIAPGRIQPSDTGESWAYLNMYFRTDAAAGDHLGEDRVNTARVSMSYPDHGGAGQPAIYEPWTDATRTALVEPLVETRIHAARFTQPTPELKAAFTQAPVVTGGSNPSVGTEVTYSMNAATSTVWPGTQIRPQLTFVAPAGWNIVANSAQMGSGAPAGVTYSYVTKVIDGQTRQVVVATWPSDITPSSTATETWPTLSVKATPTASAPTSVNAAVAQVWAGDAKAAGWSTVHNVLWRSSADQFRANPFVTDAGDVDNDSNTTEQFSSANSGALTVAASTLLSVVKELCHPDTSAADGCDWSSDISSPQLFPVNADDVKYRITITNNGSTAINDVVAYDVLPHVGDTSLLATATARGSQFDMEIESVEAVSAGLTLAYSASTNPSRPEVNPGAVGTVNDWNATAAGKKAVRIQVANPLPAGASRSVVFTASVAADAEADQLACNTVAIDSAQTLPAEPQAVCAGLVEADLDIQLGDTSDLYPNTSRTLDYTVTNLGGSANAPAKVRVQIPVNVSVTDLDVDGWSCAVVGGGAAPVDGLAELDCVPVDDDGDPRELASGAADALSLPIDIAAAATGSELCFPAVVSGDLYDPVLGNNLTTGCRDLAEPEVPELRVVKSAELTEDAITPDEADEGDELTYTFVVYNDGPGTAYDVTINDALPGLSAVSPTSVASIDSDESATFTATYVVDADDAENGSVDNSATVLYTPPTPPGGSTPDEVESPPSNEVSTPIVIAVPTIEATKTVSPDSGTIVATGDELTYTLTFANTGYIPATVDYLDDASEVFDDALLVSGPDVDGGLLTVTDVAEGFEIGGTLEPGESDSITYTVQVAEPEDRGDDTLANFLLTGDQEVPTTGACVPGGDIPCTANPVTGDIGVIKFVDSEDDVSHGDKVTYTLRVYNEGLNEGTVDLVDHLAGVLDDATFGDIVDDGGLTVEVDGDLMRITGTLGGEEYVDVVYTVIVDTKAGGDLRLLNAVAANGVDVDLIECSDIDLQCTVTKVTPPAGALPDTGGPMGANGLWGGMLLVVLGGGLVLASRGSSARHRAV